MTSLSVAYAQTQERKLLERLTKPDLSLESSFQNHSYQEGGALSLRAAPSAKRNFWEKKEARVQKFTFTRSFLGIKNPWFGNKTYHSEKMMWGIKDVPDRDKEVPVKKAQAIRFYDATKQAHFGSPVVPTHKFTPRGAAQGAVDQITEKIKKEMTIDEVRELLNKQH